MIFEANDWVTSTQAAYFNHGTRQNNTLALALRARALRLYTTF